MNFRHKPLELKTDESCVLYHNAGSRLPWTILVTKGVDGWCNRTARTRRGALKKGRLALLYLRAPLSPDTRQELHEL